MTVTAERLLRGVKRNITMPASQVLMTDSDILEIADDIISSKLVTMLLSLNQDYFIYLEEEQLVAGQTEYSIPYRSVGRTLRYLNMRDNNNNITDLGYVSLENAYTYANSSYTVGFYFASDKIHLVPNVPDNLNQTLYLQKWYPLPPSKLVESDEVMVVTSISPTSVDVASVPSSFIAGVAVDFIQARQGNTIYALDKSILSVAGTTINFAPDTIPALLAVGDYIALAGQSPVINFIPDVAYNYLENRVSEKVLKAIGDYEGLKALNADKEEEKEDLEKILEPRIDGKPVVITNNSGLVRGNKFFQRSWLFGNG